MIPAKPVSLCPYFVCNSLSSDCHGLSVESIYLRFDGKLVQFVCARELSYQLSCQISSLN